VNTRLNLFLERHKLLLAAAKIVMFFRDKYRVLVWTLGRSSAIKRYLRSHTIRKLQIGAGGYILKDWLNTDIYPSVPGVIYIDARKPFPFKDSTLDYIFSEHQIEHLTYDEGLIMLRECWRALKPGGSIRIATPDLEAISNLYASNKSDLQQRYIKWMVDKYMSETGIYHECFVINNAFLDLGHRFIYDRATLHAALGKIGFVDITDHEPGESDDKVFRGIEVHGRVIGDEDINRFETMVLQARRP
jgi:predicted SAM-dependent methyltransferase